jgi:predicted TIM-barrel fold metal-dependent hydrolase
VELRYAAARAHNRAMADFCGKDERLMGVALLPLDDPQMAIAELGAGWVPQMLKRLDWVAEIWRKSEPELAALKTRPSEQILQHMAFTPYPYEDVGDLIRQSDQRLYLFSSDYPHVEGGRNPLGRFTATMSDCSESVIADFYANNFARLFAL